MGDKKLLIIEDDTDLREGLNFSFAGDGYEVSDVGNKREGLQEIKKGIYDLVLLDCNLPDGTGFELCKVVTGVCDKVYVRGTYYSKEGAGVGGIF